MALANEAAPSRSASSWAGPGPDPGFGTGAARQKMDDGAWIGPCAEDYWQDKSGRELLTLSFR